MVFLLSLTQLTEGEWGPPRRRAPQDGSHNAVRFSGSVPPQLVSAPRRWVLGWAAATMLIPSAAHGAGDAFPDAGPLAGLSQTASGHAQSMAAECLQGGSHATAV